MSGATRRRRPGFSLVEGLVGVAILAGAVAAMMTLTSGEIRGASITEDHLLASQLLSEMKQAFGGRTLTFYSAFPAPPAPGQPDPGPGLAGLAASLVEEDPVYTGRLAGFGPDPDASEQALLDWIQRREVKRGIYQAPDPATGAVQVVFRVQYKSGGGAVRALESSEFLYP